MFTGICYIIYTQQHLEHNAKIVLFDMDGTLTPPREKLDQSLVETLSKLSKHSEIGIVSGSDYEYIMQQCGLLTMKDQINLKLHILPCNGTMHYAPPSYRKDSNKLVHSNNMRTAIGDADLNKLFKKLLIIRIILYLITIFH